MSFIEPITITNVLEKSPGHLAAFMNSAVLAYKLPQYHPNQPLTVATDILPKLGQYANMKAYVTELYNVVISAFYEQKGFKRQRQDGFDEGVYTDLEAKKEILYRTAQALESLYEAASRLMTGIGTPEKGWSRVP